MIEDLNNNSLSDDTLSLEDSTLLSIEEEISQQLDTDIEASSTTGVEMQISEEDFLALAIVTAGEVKLDLEDINGDGVFELDLQDMNDEMNVVYSIFNRVNADIWVNEFGSSPTDQIFGAGQYQPVWTFNISREELAIQGRAYAIDKITEIIARRTSPTPVDAEAEAIKFMAQFYHSITDPSELAAANDRIGTATEFRGNGTQNVYRQGRYDNVNEIEPTSGVTIIWQ